MNCHFAKLEQDALLHIVGPDALAFLQGQTSCDTRDIDAEHALPGVYCTPKGRAVCDFLLCELGPEHVALRMRRNIRNTAGQTFGKYIIFSKATLEDTRDDWTPVAVWGDGAANALQVLLGSVPDQRFGARVGEGFALIQLDDEGEQFEIYLHDSCAGDLLSRMGEAMQACNETAWQVQQIRAGIARIEATTAAEHVPQSLNYDLTGHISFTKGCYTGQEVVARLHYRGTPKRRTYLVESASGADSAPGTPVYSASTGKSIGSVVNAAATAEGICLLVEATTEGAAHELRLGTADGASLHLCEQPYSIQSDQD